MANKKNIDRLFQEKFKDFEVFPERDLWADIGAKLDMASSGSVPEKRKKVIPWWRLGGIAAAIALLLSLGINFLFLDHDDIPAEDPIEKIVEEHKPATEEIPETKGQDIEGNDSWVVGGHSEKPVETYGSTSQTRTSKKSTEAGSTSQPSANTEIAATSPSTSLRTGWSRGTQKDIDIISQPHVATTGEKDEKRTENTREDSIAEATDDQDKPGVIASEEDRKEENGKKSLLEAIAEMENEADKEKELALKQGKGTKKWSLNPNVAPVYYNSLSGGSPIDPEFSENSKSGKVNLSYGVNVAYQVSDRVSLRSGINKVNYGYNTNDISFAPNFEARALSNINYASKSSDASGLRVTSADAPPTFAPSNPEVASSFAPQEGLMQQEFGYIEVPMEVKYRVVDKRLGLNLIGGVSSLFLTDNIVLVKSESLATELGEANNVNNVNFSTNVGLGVDYLLSDKLQLQVEPMFKYQLNTFSNDSGGFKPYSFGVYTGFSFRF